MFKKKKPPIFRQVDCPSASNPLADFSSPEQEILAGCCMNHCCIRDDLEECKQSCQLEFGHSGAHLCEKGHYWR